MNLARPNGLIVVNQALYEDYFEHFSQASPPSVEIREVLREFNLDFFSPKPPVENAVAGNGIRSMACWVHVTNACNLACEYCYVRKSANRMEEGTANRIIQSLKRTAKANGLNRLSLAFAGGEPSLNLPVIRMFCQALSRLEGVHTTFSATTNATNVSDAFVDLLREFNFRVYVSIDGVGKFNDARKFVNGKPSFEAVCKGLAGLVETIGVNRVSVGIVVSPVNLAGLDEITRFLLDRGIQFKYSFYRPGFLVQGAIGGPVDAAARSAFSEFCGRLLAKLKSCLAIIREKAPLHFNPEAVVDKFSVRGNGSDAVCTMGDRYFAIGWDGRISRCHMIQDSPLAKISDDIDVLEMARNRGNPHPPAGSMCKTCDIRGICRTGCRLLLDPKGETSVYHEVFAGIFEDYVETIAAATIRNGAPLNFTADDAV